MKTILCLFTLLVLTLLPAPAQGTDAEALAFLKTHTPKIFAALAALKDAEPDDYRSALDDARKAAADHAKFSAAGDTNAAAAAVKMYEIDFAAIGVADGIVASKNDTEKQRLTNKLRGLIDASFEQWIIVEQARIQRLDQELAALKSEVANAITNRAKVVSADTAQLIEESRTFRKNQRKQK
jgi:hypothetical protein